MAKNAGTVEGPKVRFSLRLSAGENEAIVALAAIRGISRQRMIRFLIRRAHMAHLLSRPKT